MKKLLILVPALFMMISCKKNYSCTCNEVSTVQNGGYINQTQYNVKEYNEQGARDRCTDMYVNNVAPKGDHKREVMNVK